MEKITSQKYKDLKIEYFILPKTKRFILSKEIELKELIHDNFVLFESEIGDEIEGKDWKKFKLVYYGIVIRLENNEAEGFIEDFEFDTDKVIQDGLLRLNSKNEKSPFGVRYKILWEN